jgi:rhamnopyranosyl-N-acetylglucosaminyl-diphospho-decaprenol beta-1,3/1,4-galactofuranosyltransferase
MSEPELDAEPRLHGVLVTFQRPEELGRSLAVLEEQTRLLDTLVVVDNSPAREAESVVARSAAAGRVDYLASGRNLGPAGGIALGMEHCLQQADDGDWVCLFDDDDPVPDHDILMDRMRHAACCVERDVGGFGDGGGVLDRKKGRLRPASPGGDADYLGSGYCPLYRVRAIRSVGTFDAELFFGFDDLEYGLRLNSGGWRLEIGPEPRPFGHPRRPPSLAVGALDWRRYYSLRNLVYLLRRSGHGGAAVRVALVNGVAKPVANLPFRPRLAWGHLAMNIRAIRDAWAGRLGLTLEPDAGRRVGKG